MSRPGRASASPSVDLLITLLTLGADGWKQKLQERKQMYTELQQRLAQLAERHGERLLTTRNNPISIGGCREGRAGVDGVTHVLQLQLFASP